MQNFKIAFFSSSDFCIPIVQNIKQNQGKTLLEIYSEQVIAIRTKSEYSTVFPLDFDIQDIPELDLPIKLSLVVSRPDSDNRGKVVSNPVSKWAKENNLNLFIPDSFNKSRHELDLEIDLAITASFGQIITEDSLNWSKNGFLNWHPSLLPQYRGATPMQSSIKNSDKESGLSWINMTKGLDEGDIFLQFNTNIEQDNFLTLSQRLGELGARTWSIAIVNKLVKKYLQQNESNITFCGKLTKEDRIVSPSSQTASEIHNQFRAYNIFPGAAIMDEYFDGEIKIIECSLYEAIFEFELNSNYGNWLVTKDGKVQRVFLECKDNTFLEILKIKLATGKDLNLSGYQFKNK
jgi:methionyl-tRNA formyltransferase